MNYRDPQLCELLAAEYVLGTLQGKARQRFEGLLHIRPDLRSRVQEWELRLPDTMDSAPAVTPPPQVWKNIEQRLFQRNVSTRWFERLAFWRNLALGSGLLAGTLALLLFLAPHSETPGPIALISNPSHQTLWMISASADMDHFHVKNVQPLNPPSGKHCFLWLKPKNSKRMYALGTLPEKGESVTLSVSRDLRDMLPGQLLVTLEDAAETSPTQPSDLLEFQGKWISFGGA
jgi:anti-sigma-K factor RskA